MEAFGLKLKVAALGLRDIFGLGCTTISSASSSQESGSPIVYQVALVSCRIEEHQHLTLYRRVSLAAIVPARAPSSAVPVASPTLSVSKPGTHC